MRRIHSYYNSIVDIDSIFILGKNYGTPVVAMAASTYNSNSTVRQFKAFGRNGLSSHSKDESSNTNSSNGTNYGFGFLIIGKPRKGNKFIDRFMINNKHHLSFVRNKSVIITIMYKSMN